MGRPREPTDTIKAKGRTHMGKATEERRRAEELKVPFTDIRAPEYLSAKQKERFDYYAKMLLALRIFTELDVDCLGRYILAHDLYLDYTRLLRSMLPYSDPEEIARVQNMQGKVFNQAQMAARDLGMTITSRCKIIVPPPPDDGDDDL